MTVNELSQWLAVYPKDLHVLIITDRGPCEISPIGKIDSRYCAMTLLPEHQKQKILKGELP